MKKYLKFFIWASSLNIITIFLVSYAYNFEINKIILPIILFLFGELQGYNIYEYLENLQSKNNN